ncbi:hypothetical protein JW926_05105 [Candidatus Sumerlaeota bacterium]|nr:hypothetical protein [Candidatus Sumerlaeota bacterium]
MKTKGSRLLVIDASVARSAGETEHPVSMSCRVFLQDIKKICHKLVMTSSIHKEWKRHQSRYTTKWLSAMIAKKKFKYLEESVLPNIDINLSKVNIANRCALKKDLLLIKAAISSDGVIITTDKKIINIFSKYTEQIKTLKTIRWINPVQDNPECLKDL